MSQPENIQFEAFKLNSYRSKLNKYNQLKNNCEIQLNTEKNNKSFKN